MSVHEDPTKEKQKLRRRVFGLIVEIAEEKNWDFSEVTRKYDDRESTEGVLLEIKALVDADASKSEYIGDQSWQDREIFLDMTNNELHFHTYITGTVGIPNIKEKILILDKFIKYCEKFKDFSATYDQIDAEIPSEDGDSTFTLNISGLFPGINTLEEEELPKILKSHLKIINRIYEAFYVTLMTILWSKKTPNLEKMINIFNIAYSKETESKHLN